MLHNLRPGSVWSESLTFAVEAGRVIRPMHLGVVFSGVIAESHFKMGISADRRCWIIGADDNYLT